MKSRITKWATNVAGAVAIATSATGCTYTCDEILACVSADATGGGSGTGGEGGAGGGPPDVCPDDPAGGPVAPECGVWLSASLGDDTQPGTQAAPVRSLTKAIQRAQVDTGRIYACGETYAGPVQVPSGISLSGGFVCGGHGWAYAGKEKPAIIVSSEPDVPALTLLPGDEPSLWTDVEVEAADAEAPGSSSVAVFSLGARASFRRAHLIAGDGADGLDGLPGDHDNAPAKKGLPRNDGENACTADVGLGGTGLELQCEAGGVISTGGAGGDGGSGAAGGGLPGLQPPDPNDLGFGAAGQPEDAVAGTACTYGHGGAQGHSGVDGWGGKGLGSLTEAGYTGAPGDDGFPGTPGQGGGGGGGSIGSPICGAKQGGAGGGAGGTGGCGGKAGQGGGAGGSSIGIAMLGGVIRVQGVLISTGDGGRGGNGGAGQLGGQGGLPGKGGLGFGGAGGVKSGCGGGIGGNGGNGGNGGGGLGGHSVGALIAMGGYLEEIAPVDVWLGVKGAGGQGGNPNMPGTNGENGIPSPKLVVAP